MKKNLGLIDHFVVEVFISINSQKKNVLRNRKLTIPYEVELLCMYFYIKP